MQSQAALRQAVEQQLDLILKIEEERKVLKRENKMLKEEHQKMMSIVKKYNSPKQEIGIGTQPFQQLQTQALQKPSSKHQHVQVDLELNHLNTSKISIAQQLLKNAPVTLQPVCQKCEENKMSVANREQTKKRSAGNTQQVGNEIVKMAKEIASLKKMLADSQKQSKNKEKELKQLRRCLEVKSEALEKSRKDFNELSQVFNTDKYKSVRAMGEELTKVKARLSIVEQENRYTIDLKRTLQEITNEYEAYRQDRQHRIERLLVQLKEKDSRCEQLSRQMESFGLQTSRI